MAGKGGGGCKVLRYTASGTANTLAVSGVAFTEDDVAVIVITKAGAAAVRAPGLDDIVGTLVTAFVSEDKRSAANVTINQTNTQYGVCWSDGYLNYSISDGALTLTLNGFSILTNSGLYEGKFNGDYDVTVYLKEGV